FLGRAAPIVRHRRHVGNRADPNAGSLQRTDSCFATRTRTLHDNVDLLHAVFLSLTRCILCRNARRIWRALTRALEARRTAACPADGVAHFVRHRDDRVVERGMHIGRALGHHLRDLFTSLLTTSATHRLSYYRNGALTVSPARNRPA